MRIACGSAVLFVALACLSGDALAMGCGGGGGGGRGVGVSGGGRNSTARKAKETFKPYSLPAAESVASLDSSKFDAVSVKLGLSESQVEQISTLKRDLQAQAAKLETEQNQARDAYLKTTCEGTCRAAAQGVATTAQACKQYNANSKFESGLANILTREQFVKYRELSA